jgi:hypothetical protein
LKLRFDLRYGQDFVHRSDSHEKAIIATMNAPDKLLKISPAPGIYIIRAAPAKARSSRRRTAALLLAGLRRASHARGGKTGRKYLKEIRAARYAR